MGTVQGRVARKMQDGKLAAKQRKSSKGSKENSESRSSASPKKMENGGSVTPVKRSMSPREMTPVTLSSEEAELVTDSFNLVAKTAMQGIGVIAFTSFFERHPESKDYFDEYIQFKNQEVMKDQLAAHAMRVMGIVEKVTSRIDHPEKVVDLLQDLGRRHATQHHVVPDFFLILGNQFVQAIKSTIGKDGPWTDETDAAWVKFFQFVDYHMKLGHLQALEDMNGEDNVQKAAPVTTIINNT